jgi:hypothetical protein
MKTMQEIDTIYRAEMGRARQEARQEDRSDLILSQLNRRMGNLSIDLQSQVKALPLEMLGILGVDLLDFSGLEDLVRWMEAHRA